MRRQRNTKILATLGLASSSPSMIRRLWLAGNDVFRLHFNHGSHNEHLARPAAIRQLEAEMGRPIAVLADLQGPKLRLGRFREGKVPLCGTPHKGTDHLFAGEGDSSSVGLPSQGQQPAGQRPFT